MKQEQNQWAELLPQSHLTRYLGRSRVWIWRQSKEAGFPARHRIGGTIFYKRSEIDAWISRHRVPSETAAA